MSPLLRSRLAAQPETLQDFELAAKEKFAEAWELLVENKRGAGIYLLGYTAEMVLKNACFRLGGATPAEPVRPMLGPAKTWMRIMEQRIDHESYHSVVFWMQFLRLKRLHMGQPLSPEFDQHFQERVKRIYELWWVEMRYRPDTAQPLESWYMFDDVSWLLDNYTQLVEMADARI